MSKKIPVSVALAIAIIAMTITFAITWLGSMEVFNSSVAAITSKQAQYSKLSELDTYVRDNYYGDIDDVVLNDRIAQGYLVGVGDKYATYYTEKEYTEQLEYESGDRVGVGLEVVRDADTYFRIARVYENSPAAAAGVEPEGRITEVNGVDTSTLTSVRALKLLLRDNPGNELALTCVYDKADEREFLIQHVNYTTPTVEYTNVDGLAYIRISAFERATAAEFAAAVKKAQSDGVLGFVFDLRGNPGGMYAQSYEMIDLISPLSKAVAYSENKSGVTRVLATSDESAIDAPMVALVNANTAAAAELFAVSVRDLCGGHIAGVTTVGKGMMQSPPQRLADGSAVSVTVAKLLTSTGESYDGIGVIPDVEVLYESSDERRLINPNLETDPQILRSFEILRTTLGKAAQPTVQSPTSAAASTPATQNDPGAPTSSDSSGSSKAEDGGSSKAEDGGTGNNGNGQGREGNGQDNNDNEGNNGNNQGDNSNNGNSKDAA